MHIRMRLFERETLVISLSQRVPINVTYVETFGTKYKRDNADLYNPPTVKHKLNSRRVP